MSGVSNDASSSPFSMRAVLGVVVLGAVLFAALLWMIGTGNGLGSDNDGQAHARGRGLNGYAAMVDYLGRRGYEVSEARREGALDPDGLLVLTPPPGADGQDIARIVSAHRYDGPTLVVAPKWIVSPPSARQQREGTRKGWVNLNGIAVARWRGFLDNVGVGGGKPSGALGPKAEGPMWRGLGLSGTLPSDKYVLWGTGNSLIPLVTDRDGHVLAGLVDDGGTYPDLEGVAQGSRRTKVKDEDLYPLVVVFEPDLLDNYGMADGDAARLLDALMPRLEVETGDPVVFDLTLNGFGQARNLLTLAVTPPFLGVTLCLALAALLAGWRAFVRFGPAAAPERAIAFGKQALVANSAGLIQRARRFHLLRAPYAQHTRERLVRALALPRGQDAATTDAAIDRALEARAPQSEPFSHVVDRLTRAGRPHEILKAARDLHALERTLTQ